MGGTLTRDEWLKIREGADTPRGVGRQHRNPACTSNDRRRAVR
jgi:hypothetical protein